MSGRRSSFPYAPHIARATKDHFVRRKGGTGVERVSHFSAGKLFELPGDVDQDCGSLLAEEVELASCDAWGGVEISFEIMLPLFFAVFGIKTGQQAAGSDSENEFAVGDWAGYVRDIFFGGPGEMSFRNITL